MLHGKEYEVRTVPSSHCVKVVQELLSLAQIKREVCIEAIKIWPSYLCK